MPSKFLFCAIIISEVGRVCSILTEGKLFFRDATTSSSDSIGFFSMSYIFLSFQLLLFRIHLD